MKKYTNAGCNKGAWMRTQLRLNFTAGQAEHGIDDIITIIF